MTARRFLVMLLCVFVWAVMLVWLHYQFIRQSYRLEDLRQERERLTAARTTLDARVSRLSQPHLVARRLVAMEVVLVSPFEEAPETGAVRVAQVGVLRATE